MPRWNLSTAARGVLKWEAPGNDDNDLPTIREIDHQIVVQQLRRIPRQWGVIAIEVPSLHGRLVELARQIAAGRLAAYRPAGFFEAAVRRHDGLCRLHVRYNPEPDEPR